MDAKALEALKKIYDMAGFIAYLKSAGHYRVVKPYLDNYARLLDNREKSGSLALRALTLEAEGHGDLLADENKEAA